MTNSERAKFVPGLWSEVWACDMAGREEEKRGKVADPTCYPTRFLMKGEDGNWRRVYMRVYKRRRFPMLFIMDGGKRYYMEPLDIPGLVLLGQYYDTPNGGVVRVEFDYEGMFKEV